MSGLWSISLEGNVNKIQFANPGIKNSIISAAIYAKMGEGMTLPQAIDAVLGSGTFEKLAGEVYDELRARKGS